MKIKLLSISVLLLSSSLFASSNTNNIQISGELKVHHILTDQKNAWAPTTGSAAMLKLKMITPEFNNFSFGIASYTTGDTGVTKTNTAGETVAAGMFMGDVTSDTTETKTVIGESYLQYNNYNYVAKIGRQLLDTPMTSNLYSTTPNFYEAVVLGYKLSENINLVASHVNKMSYGARSLTDFALIGEKTLTAGASSQSKTLRGEFTNMGVLATGTNTDGIIALGAKYNENNVSTQGWLYLADDLVNIGYFESNYNKSLVKQTKFITSIQYLTSSYKGQLSNTADSSVAGVKLTLAHKGSKYYIAYNNSSKTTINPWGGDPLYTSSIFSRNGYRDNVSAYKIGMKYKIQKGLKIIASYADYGKSNMTGVTSNATETDFALVYKPNKKTMLKLIHANRTSEFNSVDNDRTQKHLRVIASYKF